MACAYNVRDCAGASARSHAGRIQLEYAARPAKLALD